MNRDAYLQRIGYAGPLAPTATTLAALHVAHLRAVPFENLDISRGQPIRLDLPSLYAKIVTRRRGGFCYELNGLFAWLLDDLGYQVDRLAAGVARQAGGFGPSFDHLTLRVRCPRGETPWLADVGFGDSFVTPLRLDTPTEQPDGGRAYRLDPEGETRILWQRDAADDWERQYRFDLLPHNLAEYEPMCLYHQTSPQSSFTQRRVCTLATADGRVTLAEGRLITTRGGEREERPVAEAERAAILRGVFGVSLEEQP